MCSSAGSYDTAKVWLRKFKNGDFQLKGQLHSRRPVAVDKERPLELVQESPWRNTCELIEEHEGVERIR